MTSRSPLLLAACAFCALLISPLSSVAAPRARIDRAIGRTLSSGDRLRVIVRTKSGHRRTVASRLRDHGDTVTSEMASIEAITAEVNAGDIERLAADEAVDSISFDAPITAFADEADRETGGTYADVLRRSLGLPMIQRFTGSSVGVAVIDSGIRGSYDVRVTAFYDFTDGVARPGSPQDDYGHGSHVASLIGASGERTQYLARGVAPDVRVIGLRVLDRKGVGRTSDVIAAIEFAVANRGALGIDIINLSLGHPVYEPAESDPLVQAVEAAVRAGIVVVVSAGNCGVMSTDDPGQCGSRSTDPAGYAGITSPGNAPSAITVGSYSTNDTGARGDDRMSFFSSRGPTWYDGIAKPDLVAPGENMVANGDVRQTLFQIRDEEDNRLTRVDIPRQSRRLMKLSGTSMAAAVASGVVALILDAHRQANFQGYLSPAPPLTPGAVKAILQYSAIPLRTDTGVEYDELTQGVGSVNAGGAIALATAINTRQPAGSVWLKSSVIPQTSFGFETLSWGQKIVWGNHAFLSGMLYFNDPSWSTERPWGSGVWLTAIAGTARDVVWNSDVLWASKVVWGNLMVGTVVDEKIVWGYVAPGGVLAWGDLIRNDSTDGAKIVWSYIQGDDR
jgi:serine protease AprX